MTLKQKLDNEMQEFKKSYEAMTPTQIYNDWYMIGFHEEYYEMLSNILVDCDDYDYIAKWLCEFERPIQFLYSEWLSADGVFNYDWNEMLDFTKEVYRDCMANRH